MSSYYNEVASYYDKDAISFEARYWANPVLQKIRQCFREEVYKLDFITALEIGCGTGIDLLHFGKAFPGRAIYGIDVSPMMVNYCHEKIKREDLLNVRVKTGTIETVPEIFENIKFDLIFVFFGALNTTDNIEKVPSQLSNLLKPDGKLVLTFVNKWYLAEIFIQLLKLNPKKAFRRLGKVWGGYSNDKYLQSKCLSTTKIKEIFNKEFIILSKKGYSIVYPAWYRHQWLKKIGPNASRVLWHLDELINKTIFWSTGEYFLYSFKRRL